MSLELSTISLGIVKLVIPGVAKALVAKINSQLNPTDLEKALKAGIIAAEDWDKTQTLNKQLFYHCEPKVARELLERFFKDTGVQEELQKPLKDQGTPDLTFLIAAFGKAASESEELKFPEHSVETWLKKFADTYFEKTDTYLRFQFTKKDYLKQMADWFDNVKFAGIAVEGQEIEKSEKLAQIFVMPDVVEDVETRQEVVAFEPDAIVQVLGNRQAELLREQQQRAQLESRTGRKYSAVQLLSQSQAQKVVLLGAPGSGKTTLMGYFAVMLAQKQPEKLELAAEDWLPILIRIRDLTRQPDIGILDYARQFAQKTLTVKSLPVGFFEYWLEDGRALILLDGLDEVAEEAKRYDAVRRIENFLGQFDKNRAIITSRPAGYNRDFFRTEEFPHYQLQAFDDAKIEEFINRWYDSRVPDKAEAQRRKDSLNKALSQHDRIKLLARNPLLLTIIALIHRYQALLPKERYKLYDKAVETLITNWDKNKELSNHEVLKYLGLDDLRRLMESLAYWIHGQGVTGDREGGTLIDRDELIEQLSKTIKTQKQIELSHARKEAQRFVDFMRDRTGLLNEQGQDCYAFVHKTFQEYLCAQEINYQADNEGDFDIVLNHIADHLHDPHWREVLLLLIAQQKPKKAARAIRVILDKHSDYEQWLHRDLFFAGSCLAENPKDLKVADNSLPTEVLEPLVELEVSSSPQVTYKIRDHVFQTLCSLNGTDFEALALQMLKDKADRIDEVRLQQYRAALGEEEGAIAILLALLKDKNYIVRSNTAQEALGKLGNTSKPLLQGLLALLTDKNSDVCYRAAQALGILGNTSEPVLQGLLALLIDKAPGVRSSAAQALGILGNTSEPVLQGLLALLTDDKAPGVRSSAAQALGKLENTSEPVLQGLLALLTNKDSSVRSSAAQALGKLGNTSEPVLQGLLALLTNKDSSVRSSAAQALGKLGIPQNQCCKAC